jgi:hypothetical protein
MPSTSASSPVSRSTDVSREIVTGISRAVTIGVEVFDLAGRRVAHLHRDRMEQGHPWKRPYKPSPQPEKSAP